MKPLTPRQMVVLQGVATGRTHQSLANEVGLAVMSIGRELERIRAKLGAKSTPHAIHLAHLAGLLRRDLR